MTKLSRPLRSSVLALLGATLLAACAPPPAQVSIRPGIGQDVDLDTLRPPSGVTYRYMVEIEQLPLPVELVLTSRRRGNGQYDYVGNYIYTLPSGEGLEDVTRVFREALEVDDLQVTVRGNQLLVPYRHTSDNRFRIAVSTYQAQSRRTVPHDCFATLGSCQFTSTISGDPLQVKFLAETSEVGGVWTSRLRADPSQRVARQLARQTLTYSLDKNAVPIDLVVQSSLAGMRETTVFRRQ